MRRLLTLTTGAICIVAAGCISNDVVVRKQMEIEARLEQLAQANVAANARMTELSTENTELRKQIKGVSADMEALRPSYNEFKASFEVIYQKLAEINRLQAASQTVGTSQGGVAAASPSGENVAKIEVVNKEAAPADKESAPQDAYMHAFGFFSANNYAGAIEAFRAFVKNYPASEYAGNALYWMGECYYTQKDYAKAMESFSSVVSNYPKGNKVPDAMLKIGYSLISMNEIAKAKAALQSLVEKYPKSQASVKARERLGRL
jgi:tol-pal system protein YbgF